MGHDGEVVTTTYDVQGMPATLSSSTGGSYVSGAAYNAADGPTSISLANARTLNFGYRPEDLQLTSMSVSGDLLSNTYTYDKAFNVSTIDDDFLVAPLTFTYDHLNRLTRTEGLYDSEYAYDEIGNMEKKRENEWYTFERESVCSDEIDNDVDGRINDGCTATYPFMCYSLCLGGTGGGPHALKYVEGDNPAFKPAAAAEAVVSTVFNSSYDYDANGNLLDEYVGGVYRNRYIYDAEGRVSALITYPGLVTSLYTYGEDGTQYKRLTNNPSSAVVYISGIYEKNTVSGVVTKYYHANGQRVAMRQGTVNPGTLSFITPDYLGSTALVTNANGALVNRTRYFP